MDAAINPHICCGVLYDNIYCFDVTGVSFPRENTWDIEAFMHTSVSLKG